VKAGKNATGRKKPADRTTRTSPPRAGTTAKTARAGKRVKVAKPVKPMKPAAPEGRVKVRELDPQQKCGEGTSVQFLYRVDQTVEGRAAAHLVFFDQHGWYCEHGRTCPAVAHAKKHNGQFGRVS
jgi:hypothetical protein